MKWKKFQRLLRRNPDVDTFIRMHIGPFELRNAQPNDTVEDQRIEWVEEKVRFVAFRDFNTLNLEQKQHVTTEHGVLDTPTRTKLVMRCTEVRFFIHFHIVGVGKPCSRMLQVDDMEVDDSLNIRETLRKQLEWHKESYLGKGKPIKFDYVVQHTQMLENDARPPMSHTPWNPVLISESLELYRFPENFTLPPMPADDLEEDGDFDSHEHDELYPDSDIDSDAFAAACDRLAGDHTEELETAAHYKEQRALVEDFRACSSDEAKELYVRSLSELEAGILEEGLEGEEKGFVAHILNPIPNSI